MLHILAIAHEIGMDFEIDLPIRSVKRLQICVTWLQQDIHTLREHLNEAGGVYALMHELNKKGLFSYRVYDSDRKDTGRKY